MVYLCFRSFINSCKIAKHSQTIRRWLAANCLSVFDHFVGLTHKGLIERQRMQVRDYEQPRKLMSDI